MKILRLIPNFYPYVTGPANQAFKISHELEKRSISSPIITSNFNAESSPTEERIGEVYVKRLPIRGGYMQYHLTPGVIRILFGNYDIIHAHSYRNFVTDMGFLTSRLRNRPFILQAHGSLLGYKYELGRENWRPYRFYDSLTFKSVARRADAVIVSTRQELEEALEFGVDKSKIKIIPVGVELNQHTKIKGENDGIRVLFVGRIGRSRNVEQILRAFKIVAQNQGDIKLYIVGGEESRSCAEKGGYLPELRALCQELRIDKNVVFTGPLYGDELKESYASSDIFVYTSYYENFGQTILEAAASELPVISTPVGVARDIVINGKTGYLINFDDVDGLAFRLSELIDGREKRIKMGGNMLLAVREREYDWGRIIEEYVRLYEEVLKR